MDVMMRSYLMTWIPKLRRWAKRYRGKQFTISCRQLGCAEETKEASWRLANAWWKERQAEITLANRKPSAGSPEAVEAILRAWGGPDMGLPEALLSFMAYFSDKPLPTGVAQALLGKEQVGQLEMQARVSPIAPAARTVGHHFTQWYDGQRAKVASGEIAPDRADVNRVCLAHFIRHIGEASPLDAINETCWRSFVLACRAKVADKQWSSAYAASILRAGRSFVRCLWESNLIELPRNLQSRDLSVKVKLKKKIFFTLEELRRQVEAAHGPLRLHLLWLFAF
jgi:hypothetical protein